MFSDQKGDTRISDLVTSTKAQCDIVAIPRRLTPKAVSAEVFANQTVNLTRLLFGNKRRAQLKTSFSNDSSSRSLLLRRDHWNPWFDDSRLLSGIGRVCLKKSLVIEADIRNCRDHRPADVCCISRPPSPPPESPGPPSVRQEVKAIAVTCSRMSAERAIRLIRPVERWPRGLGCKAREIFFRNRRSAI
jgi:hypothetical protein